MTALRAAAVIALAVAAAGGAWWLAAHRSAAERDRAARRATAAVAEDSRIREADIAFYRRRAREDPQSAGDRSRLALLYLGRSRQGGGDADARRAEELAQQSLALRGRRNAATYAILATALVSQHKFVEARDAAAALVAAEPGVAAWQAILGELSLELGDYATADSAFSNVRRFPATLATMPRLARWQEFRGNTDQARRLYYAAARQAAAIPSLSREQAAWFQFRVGDFELRRGHLRQAEEAFEAGLASAPGDHRLLAAMARLAWLRSEWRDVVAYGSRSIATAPEPGTIALMHQALAALGDSARAGAALRELEAAVAREPGGYHRAWLLFLLDHNQRVDEVLEFARTELETRRDVHAWDILAWALYRAGRMEEAARAMDTALAQGTLDASFFYHAGAIARAGGHDAQSREWLQRALDLNPHFDPRQMQHASAILDSIRGRG